MCEPMDYRLPYYMAYPLPLEYDDDRMEQRDFDYMKSMYPELAKKLLPFVEEECERMSYEGSVIYDEYPDQLQIRLMCNRIYDRAKEKEENPGDWLRDLIQVMLYQEMYKRRSDHRKYRRKYF